MARNRSSHREPPLPPDTPERWRAREVRKLRQRLEREGFPRLEMFLLVGVTGAVGLIASWGLRQLGLASMGWRYLLALALAYVVFLALLRGWLRMRPNDRLDVPQVDGDFLGDVPGDGGGLGGGGFSGGGGHFGGGGASGSFGAPFDDVAEGVADGAGSLGVDAALDADGCALPLLVVAALVAIGVAALTVVWSAPTLFAELMLDGLLAAGLYRRLKHAPPAQWLETALRRTAWPFVATCLLVVGGGFVLQALAPGADTLGEALAALRG
jgi:uncharacterized membrane protein YgcG